MGLESVFVGGVAHGNWDTMGINVGVRSMNNVGCVILVSGVFDITLLLNRNSVGRFVFVLEASVVSVERFAMYNWDVLVFHLMVIEGYGNGQQGRQCDELKRQRTNRFN